MPSTKPRVPKSKYARRRYIRKHPNSITDGAVVSKSTTVSKRVEGKAS